MIAWMAMSAWAGDGLLSGGLSVSPTTASLIVPSWRLGYSGGRFTAWGSATWASFDAATDDPDTVSGFVLRPRVGAQLAFADRGPDSVAPYVAAGASTLLFGLALDDDQVLDDEQVEGRLPYGLTGGFGLDAGITEVLSVAAEVGVDWETGRWEERGRFVTTVSAATTYAGLYLNLWL